MVFPDLAVILRVNTALKINIHLILFFSENFILTIENLGTLANVIHYLHTCMLLLLS